jgi:hypothetical protein
MEEIGPPTAAFPDDGVAQGPGLFRDGDGFGTSRRDFTSPSGGGNIISSVGSDNGPDGQDGGEPLPMPFNELNADYSSFTLDGLFPTALTGSEFVNSLIMNGQILFGDSDSFSGLSVNAFGSSSLGLSIFHPLEDRTGKRGSGGCSSDGSSVGVGRCMEGDLSSLMPASQVTGSDAGYEPAQQSSNFPGSNAPFGGNSLSASQILEMTAAQNCFPMTSPWGMIQGTFPSACCDVTPPVVDGAFTAAGDFGNPNESQNSGPAPIPLGDSPSYPAWTGQGPGSVVPEIPQWAMLLIGFAALALVGRRRLSPKSEPMADA